MSAEIVSIPIAAATATELRMLIEFGYLLPQRRRDPKAVDEALKRFMLDWGEKQ